MPSIGSSDRGEAARLHRKLGWMIVSTKTSLRVLRRRYTGVARMRHEDTWSIASSEASICFPRVVRN